MNRLKNCLVILPIALLVASCRLTPQPPVAKVVPYTLEKFGDIRTDNYYWLHSRDSQDVMNYLIAENNYTEAVMGTTLPTQKKLYNEIKSRYCETDESVPVFQNGYYYYIRYEEGKEYPINCRRKGKMTAPEEVILDENEIAAGHSFCDIASIDISPNNRYMAYGIDTIGRRKYNIVFKDLTTGLVIGSQIENTTGSVAWANDNKTVFYSQKDASLRPYKIFRHSIDSKKTQNDVEVFHETDPTFSINVFTSKSKEYILIASLSTLTTEYRILDANTPNGTFTVVQPRIANMEYHVYPVDNKLYIQTNWKAENFRIMETCINKPSIKDWVEVIPQSAEALIMDIDVFRDFMVIIERSNALIRTRIHKLNTSEDHYIDFGEETYTALPYYNPEFATNTYLYEYNSPTTPNTIFEYNMLSREKRILKHTEILGNYNPSSYTTKQLWATASDSVRIPITVLHKKDIKLDGRNPMLIYAYGAYGYSENPTFDPDIFSLIDRGFIYAIAHVRGGEELGKNWYHQGRLLNKTNTFTDFATCTELLIKQKYTSPDLTIAQGGSAGGLLMGVIANTHPHLFKGIIAEVPFVDVLTSMLDESLPLTTSEYDEWGNPNDSTSYFYIKAYSPYDNVKMQNYPNMLIKTGYHDSQVQYFEPAKWVAKLRANKTDNNLLLFKIDMNAGHGGASGRFRSIDEVAFNYAFILHILGME